MGVIFLFRDPEREDRTTAGSPIVHLRDQFRHVGCGHSCCGEFAQFDEKILQFVRAGNDDPNAEDIQFEEEPERREVTIEERILVIPFGLHCNPVLVLINVVGGSKGLVAVSRDLDVEALFDPSPLEKEAVNGPGDRRFISSLLR